MTLPQLASFPNSGHVRKKESLNKLLHKHVASFFAPALKWTTVITSYNLMAKEPSLGHFGLFR